MSGSSRTQLASWKALLHHQEDMYPLRMWDLFKSDPQRAERFSLEAANLFFDYSKNRITDKTMQLLNALALETEIPQAISAMFNGQEVNVTEHRPALHIALRNATERSNYNCSITNTNQVKQTLASMENWVQAIYDHQLRGFTNKPIQDVVHIGIGGSYLGPKVLSEALKPYWTHHVRCHFVANIDGADISQTLSELNPETTLFVVATKTFTTLETLKNATYAQQWFVERTAEPQHLKSHFYAITRNIDKAIHFGIERAHIFPVWDWVGGRFSVWSAMGLPLALTIGMEGFKALLKGAFLMDEHFRTAPLEKNMPVIHGLLGIWHINFFGAKTHAIIPYDHQLRSLPAYLQQLDMESNGKSVTQKGSQVDYTTGPIIWGSEGVNGQHAYHQLLHQGTHLLPVDFILPLRSHYNVDNHHALLVANCLSQSEALMRGKSIRRIKEELAASGLTLDQINELAPHKVVPGNRTSNTIVVDSVTPTTLGALLALYEHKVFVQAVIWNVDPFDQWGVELGKQLGHEVYDLMQGCKEHDDMSSSTQALIKRYLKTLND